jgi:two-component system, OmpR family, response regulator
MTEAAAKNNVRHKLVLGVDDQQQNLAFLNTVLMGAGYTFVGVESGEHCLSLVQLMPPRLILLDIQMPDLDGFETCRRLRAMPALEAVPIAFLTARKTRDDVRTGIAAGGNDFIVKPCSPQKLLERVGYWTSRRANVA